MNARELATVLAALRHWQNALVEAQAADLSPFHFSEGARPLSIPEIDRLAERLNCPADQCPAQLRATRPRRANRKFKVWVYVEAIDEADGQYFDLMDLGFLTPPSLGEFSHFEEAWRFVLSLPGYQYDTSDLAALGQAAQIEKEVWESPARQAGRYEKEVHEA